MPRRIASRLSRMAATPSVHQDFARVGLVEAVQDRHQRRLAGAVLADDAVDRAATDGKIDAAAGLHRPEPLVDPTQLDRWRGSVGLQNQFGQALSLM